MKCGLSQTELDSIAVHQPTEQNRNDNLVVSLFVMARSGVGVDDDA